MYPAKRGAERVEVLATVYERREEIGGHSVDIEPIHSVFANTEVLVETCANAHEAKMAFGVIVGNAVRVTVNARHNKGSRKRAPVPARTLRSRGS